MEFPSVAIVILNWNGRKHLETYLPSVVKTTYPGVRIVVADNASTDDSLAFIHTHYPQIEILRHQTNEGFAKGYNSALAGVDAKYYILLNSDVEVEPGWIEPMVALMEKDTTIAAVQPKIRQWLHKEYFEYAGAAGGWIDALGYPFCMGRVFDDCEEDRGQYDTPTPIFWASGAAMCIRSAVFREAGGFDPFFFAHQEEIDLCWRIQLMGYRIFSCPAAVVYHLGGGTLPKGNARKVFLNFRNNLVMLTKNLPVSQKWYKIPLRLGLDAISAWKNLLKGERSYFLAVARAHGAWIGWLLFRRGKAVLPLLRDGNPAGIYSGNVVWDYFVKQRRSFREIIGIDK